jgi:hypothetical protein
VLRSAAHVRLPPSASRRRRRDRPRGRRRDVRAYVAPVEPWLDIRVANSGLYAGYELWYVTIAARGGERIDEIRLERASGPVTLAPGSDVVRGLDSGWSSVFKVQVDERGVKSAIRVVQTARVSRTYLVDLEERF